jgi:hypothetical protein
MKFSLTSCPNSPPEFCAYRTKRRNRIPNFSLITVSHFNFVARPNVGRIYKQRRVSNNLLRLSRFTDCRGRRSGGAFVTRAVCLIKSQSFATNVAQILTEKAFIGLQTYSRICQRVDFAKLN